MIKWTLTLLMFCGALTTSLKLHPFMGFVFLFAGNLGWAVVQLRMREWAAASVFIVMTTTWFIGVVKYFFF